MPEISCCRVSWYSASVKSFFTFFKMGATSSDFLVSSSIAYSSFFLSADSFLMMAIR